MKRQCRGFTLIELLIVIAIILILIAIALPNFLEAQIRAKVTKAAGEIRTIGIAQEEYNLDWKQYTNDCIGSDSTPPRQGCLQLTTPIAYISELPADPFGEAFRSGSSARILLDGKAVDFYPMGTGVNPRTFQKAFATSGAPPPFSQQNLPIREAYIIYSSGPSDKEPGNPTATFPAEANIEDPSTGQGWIVYAATNGTKSFGGIIRTGGASLELPQLRHLNQTTHN